MNMKVAVVLAVVAFLAFVDAGRGRGGHRGRHNRRGGNGGRRGRIVEEPTHSWTTRVSTSTGDVTVRQTAFVTEELNTVGVNTTFSESQTSEYQSSYVLYSFPEGGEPFMTISTTGNRGGKPCFILSTDYTFDDMLAELDVRNSSTATFPSIGETQIDGTGQSIPRTEIAVLRRANPGLRRMCKRKVVDTRVEQEDEDVDEAQVETREIKVLDFDETVAITFPAERRRGGGGGRRRGQGQGRANGRGQGRARGQGRRGRGNRRRGGAESEATVEMN